MSRHVWLLLLGLSIALPIGAVSAPPFPTEPFTQTFIVTAYYSPLPGQCCYVRGSEQADKVLNGQGIASSDGTPVYPGMMAAPASYPYGTRVSLPGLGTFTVHDRGGAIIERSDGIHRLDIWVGHGELGLARALGIGAMQVTGTVYPTTEEQPPEAVNLEQFAAPIRDLEQYFVQRDSLLSVQPKRGDRGFSVRIVQQYLRDLGYFKRSVTGLFGPETQTSLTAFINDYALRTPTDQLTPELTAHLVAAHDRLSAHYPITQYIDDESSRQANQAAQRTLRYLGYYSGPTDGQYSDSLKTAIFNVQREAGVVATWETRGAGRIGPKTKAAIQRLWNQKLVAKRAQLYLVRHTAEQSGRQLLTFMEEGSQGPQVSLLQEVLADHGFFPADKANGNFGPLTKQAVIAYQLDRGLIESVAHGAAGFVGPNTLRTLRTEERSRLYAKVRAEGWHAL